MTARAQSALWYDVVSARPTGSADAPLEMLRAQTALGKPWWSLALASSNSLRLAAEEELSWAEQAAVGRSG